MTKTLDDIKREAVSAFLVEERHNDTQEDRIRRVTIQDTIDYLQAQGLLMVWNTDMDSAPRDWTEFLAYCPSAVKRKYHICHFWHSGSDTYRWEDSRCHRIEPTAWMPLPKMEVDK